MKSLRDRFKPSASHVSNLRSVVARLHSSSGQIYELPDKFANLLDMFNQAPVNESYRKDIHDLLARTVDTASAVIDSTIDADQAIQSINKQIHILANISTYLSSRPTRMGYSILFPKTQTLLGQFTTEAEAQQHLDSLIHNQYITAKALVVSVKITSQLAVRPETKPSQDLPSILISDHAPNPMSELDDQIAPERRQDLVVENPPQAAVSENATAEPNPLNPSPPRT